MSSGQDPFERLAKLGLLNDEGRPASPEPRQVQPRQVQPRQAPPRQVESPQPPPSQERPVQRIQRDELYDRLNKLTAKRDKVSKDRPEELVPGATASSPTGHVAEGESTKDHEELDSSGFFPMEPTSFREANLSEPAVEALMMKYLLARSEGSGKDIADQVKLPFVLVEQVLRRMKHEQIVFYRDSAMLNDYVYQLTDMGRQRARDYTEDCTYFGSAPVSLHDYVASVAAQSIEHQNPSEDDLNRAFDDLLVEPTMLDRLGPAVNSGRGLFLYGFPGNGKTSIAERITSAFGKYIWIPRALLADGEIIRLFDPMNHTEAPIKAHEGLLDQNKLDKRWVRIHRPTIVVGGELTMGMLEVTLNERTGISEAPLQLKSNCGTLVIDDFGRQKMSTDELLNRWIVPLEKRYDYLNLNNGKKLQVPFDQLIIFSTNLEPKDLVDDAFLRRIPYKIEITDPTESMFRELFKIMCPILGFKYNQHCVDHLIGKHYKSVNRPMRCCQPRDLLLQAKNFCIYKKLPMVLSPELFDFAVENYFAVM
jgi:hypothetical protein